MNKFAKTILESKYCHVKQDGKIETWEDVAHRVSSNVMRAVTHDKTYVKDVEKCIVDMLFFPGGRYLYAAGNQFHQTNNCLGLRAEDSREGWAKLLHKSAMALMTGAGIGVVYSLIRPAGKLIRKTGGTATGPLSLMQIINECGRGVQQGGSRRSAIWAGLNWSHENIFTFIHTKDWSEDVVRMKAKSYNFPATLDMTNISVMLDDVFFKAYHDDKHKLHSHARSVFRESVTRMLKTGEPGFSVDVGENKDEVLRNACAEVTMKDDSDICNLGSLNFSKIETLEQLKTTIWFGISFLLAGTVYSDVPYPEVDLVRTKNRRLGLGIMGIHEWLLKRGKKYGKDAELEKWLKVYQEESDKAAEHFAKEWDLSVPVKTRSIAPTGTIGIIAETTTGIEPLFCSAYKRRYRKHESWNSQYVVDPIADRLIKAGIDYAQIEDAYILANDVERRMEFQAWVQKFVDHGISSTINLPAWGTELNNENKIDHYIKLLIKYLPELRGITAYPDGARDGQPLVPVSYPVAIKHIGEIFVEQADVCDITGKGSCSA